ncbi:MAG: CDP-diacylglycerol--glycerol-3-phosphate 3-phosphatidyltransferase [Bowdeniella nasicola]|nr:CDP-diacylglycerol--glycerol-3-phosphate 3-phosphatidyltransferase [Bowdeniella nasicola]
MNPNAPLFNIANVLTIGRIILVPIFIWCYLHGSVGYQVAATIIFFIAGATDQLDGYLARRHRLVTNFGKIADPIADKALVLSAMILVSAAGLLPWWVTIVIIVRELGITALRFVMIRKEVIAASKGGKLKTVLQMLGVFMLLIPWAGLVSSSTAHVAEAIGWWIMMAALVVTVVTGLDYCLQAVKVARNDQR